MHKQIRVDPRLSPPDVAAVLALLAGEQINLVGAGGSNVEMGGELAIAVDHEQQQSAESLLTDAGYAFRVFDSEKDPELKLCWLQNEPGQLEACIEGVAEENLANGRKIRDILIGVQTDEGIPVQVFSEHHQGESEAAPTSA